MDLPEYTETQPELRDHPIFSGSQSVGMISGDNPKWLNKLPLSQQDYIQKYGHNALGADLKRMGLRAEPTEGRYETPERSYIVYGATKDQLVNLGNKYGQDSIVYIPAGHKTAKIHYTDLAQDDAGNSLKGHYRLTTGKYGYHASNQPDDYYTRIPNKGYLRLDFDWSKPPAHEGPITKSEIKEKLLVVLKKAVVENRTSPSPQDWEDAKYVLKNYPGIHYHDSPLTNPIITLLIPNGKHLTLDGSHRVIEHKRQGKTHINSWVVKIPLYEGMKRKGYRPVCFDGTTDGTGYLRQ